MATLDDFEYEQENQNEETKNSDLISRCQFEDASLNKKKFPVIRDRITANQMSNFIECDYTTVNELKKVHEWQDRYAGYVYFKEKIIGKIGKKGKKNNFYWLETNDLYLENVRSAIDADKDYWISAAEVSKRITDDDDKPVLREKWISSMPCHFLILDLNEAVEAENLNLDFNLSGGQMAELVLEHCRQRGLPEPLIWGDHEELAVIWPLKVPYKKGRNSYENHRGRIVFNEFAFNLDWNDIQDLLCKDFEYLGANPQKKHALTLLRVPGTFNTHANAPVRVFHDAEKTTVEEIKKGLEYVSDRLKRYKPIKRPDLQAKLKEFQKDNEEFLNFWNEIDGTDSTAEKSAPKPKKKKSKAVSKTKKARDKREQRQQEMEKIIAESNEARKKSLLTKIEKLSAENSPEAVKTREECEQELTRIEKYKRDRNFLEQIKQDVLRIHLASDNYVCVCFKGEKESWRQIFVQSKYLEKKLVELLSEPDFDSKNIYVSQVKFLSDKSRAIDNVASLSLSFLDIDGKFATEQKDLTSEEWSNLIIEYCREKEIPMPSIIVFSGNGLHVKWLYRKAITREKLNRWTMLQRKLWLIFKDLGADAQAKDAARVLRVPGTKNCKPETKDRDVRVVYSNPERYAFEDFAKKIFSLSGYDDAQELYEEFKTTEKPKVAEPAVKEAKVEALVLVSKPKKSTTTPPPLCDSPYFKIKNETTGEEKFVKKSEIPDFLRRQDKTHVLSRSISDFEQPDLNTVERIYCNYAVLSAEKIRGSNLKEKTMTVLKRCSEYWNGLGIPMPNALMLLDGKLVVAWKYFDYLPGKALSRWQRTQEIINYHFADWGAKDNLEYQEVSALLPIAEFTNKKAEILKLNARYRFDDLASKILRFSQDEVREYKKKKAEEKAKAKAERTLKNLASCKIKPKKRTGSFTGQAARRFADIVKLMELRANSNGEVQEGHRELSVFWAMNFAVQAGMVNTVEEFDALNQKLIDKNGIQFQSETNLKLFNSLKVRFISKDKPLYNAKTETIIEQLGITATEQVDLEVLRAFPKKEKKSKKPSIESLAPWIDEGISRRKWFYDRAEKNKKIKEKNEALKPLSPVLLRAICTTFPYIMRGRSEGEFYKGIKVYCFSVWDFERERDFSFVVGKTFTFDAAKVKVVRKLFDFKTNVIFDFEADSVTLFVRFDRERSVGALAVKISNSAPFFLRPYFAFLVRPPPFIEGEEARSVNFSRGDFV